MNYEIDLYEFQPTLPARGATCAAVRHVDANGAFQPTLPARGATWLLFLPESRATSISTHAPRTGSDFAGTNTCKCPPISTHAPRTGSDKICQKCMAQ